MPVLAVKSSTPITTINVGIDAKPSITFNNDIDPTTVSSTSVALAGPVVPAQVNQATNGTTVTLTPQAPLVWGTRYTLATTNALKDKAGQSLATQFQLNFSTAEPTWAAPNTLVTSMAAGPVVGFDGKDNALAVWQQFSSGSNSFNMHAARWDGATKAWAAPVQLNMSVPDKSVSSPLLAVDVQGNAIAVWNQSDANYLARTYAARFDRISGTWGNPTLVRAGSNSSFPWALKMDASGNALLIGQEYSSAADLSYRIFARRYVVATGRWMDTSLLQMGSQEARDPKIDLDAKGNAMAVWIEANDGYKFSVNAARYDIASDTWSPAQKIQKGPGPASNPDVAMDPAGNATAVWVEDLLSGVYVTTIARYDTTAGKWGTPQTVAMDKGSANIAKVVMDAAGNATTVWVHAHGFDLFSLNSVRYGATSGTLGSAQTIDSVALTPYSPYAMGPDVRVDPAGNVVAVWQRAAAPSGLTNVFSARYSATLGTWSAVAALQSSNIKANQFSLATDQTGSALALWCEDPNGSNDFRLMVARSSGQP